MCGSFKYFLADKIGFTDIFNVVEKVVTTFNNIKKPSLEDIFEADRQARRKTEEYIKEFK